MRIITPLLLTLAVAVPAFAVQTSHWTHTNEADFKNGTMQNVVATNLGDLKLSRATKTLLEVECGRLEVPENYDRTGRTLVLAFMVVHPRKNIDPDHPVLYLSGGPGAPLLVYAERLLTNPQVNDVVVDRDWVFYDQCGVGRSTPALRCERDREYLERVRSCRDKWTKEGVDLSRVVIGHCGDTEDVGHLEQILRRGSTIGMDRFGLDFMLPMEKRVGTLATLCKRGWVKQMVLSHDANCWTDMLSEDAKRRTRPLWHYNHISDDILPALRKAGVTDAQIEQMLVRNPRAIFEARNPA